METRSTKQSLKSRIDAIVEREGNLTDSDLNQMIAAVDDLLLQMKQNTQIKPEENKQNCEKKGVKIVQIWGKSIKKLGEKISGFCKNNNKTVTEVFDIIGQCHWAALGFLLVASVLEKLETVKHNRKECLKLLKSMNDLAKVVVELRALPHKTKKTKDKIKESIHAIIQGVMWCSNMMERSSWIHSENDKEELLDVRKEIEELRSILHVHISVCIFKWLCNNGKDNGGTEDSGTNVEQENEEDSKNYERGTKHEEASNKRSHGEAIPEEISKHEGSNKKFHREDDKSPISPNTPSPPKEKISLRRKLIEDGKKYSKNIRGKFTRH